MLGSLSEADDAVQEAWLRLASIEVRGAAKVMSRAVASSRVGLVVHRALVNGAPESCRPGTERPFSIGGFTISGGKIVETDIIAHPGRVGRLEPSILEG